ncbi:MAG: cyclopropane-fatty-acyl-phospholipid synthase family protein [Acidimicrobiia bacterium]|nr:cyclopropane-fatty-acyl-phospholipid synthase family protein [Acidimicrobiia bacterium]
MVALLDRFDHGNLEVVDLDGSVRRFGPERGEPRARVEVRDDRAWRSLLTGGSAGFGRGFVEGWWHSDDPMTVTRVIIGNLHRLDEVRNSWARVTRAPRDAIARLAPRTTRRSNRDDIATHYDISNAFYAQFLDETMTYSSAIFATADEPLAMASRRKYQRLLDKLDVGAHHELLEIGSGWGGFASHAVREAGCSVTTTTISDEQHRTLVARMAREGISEDVTPLQLDWRDLPSLGRSFDRVVSIEMIEAVDWRDYRSYFSTIERCLAPDGMVGVQAICFPDRRYQAAKFRNDFIRSFVFPGGFLPSTGALVDAACTKGRLQLIDVEDISAHYAETLRRWRTSFDNSLDAVEELGLDSRFQRLWRMYLAYCEAAFRERYCTVQQLVFAGPEWRGQLSLRPV